MSIKSLSGQQCYGCSACANVCPVRAINMKADSEGFLFPVIDESVCVNCSKCENVCPALHADTLKNDDTNVYLSVRNANKNMVKKSSSGGIFALLAEYVLAQKGVVYGAAFDDKNVLKHIRIDDFALLEKLLGSKYVQSDLGCVFTQVRADLREAKKVLFVGTPCQVAGLKAFLGKDDDNLLTADLLCHGVPSPKVWEKYLQSLNVQNKAHIEFRNKDKGWKNYSMVIDDRVAEKYCFNSYMNGFLNNIYLRNSCHNCQFCGTQRCGDFTLGDFWGAGAFRKKFDENDEGTSVIMLNSLRARKIWEQLQNQFEFCERVPELFVKQHNPSLESCAKASVLRKDFFDALQSNKSWNELTSLFLSQNKLRRKVAILNLQETNNFGACLVAFALQTVIENLGCKAEIIDFRSLGKVSQKSKERFALIQAGELFEKFRKQFLRRTSVCYNFDDLCELNSKFDTFVVGSDQVWRYSYVAKYLKIFFLDFVNDDKLLLSYAASFGVDYWEGKEDTISEVSNYLKRFGAISVREMSGENICRDVFGVKATQVLDPTLLLNRQDYEAIIKAEQCLVDCDKKYIAYMLLDENSEMFQNLQKEAASKNLKLVNIYKDEDGNYRSMGNWLNLIKNAQSVVTDSFHCVCFSLIFQKDFVCTVNFSRGVSRLQSLLESLHLEDRLIQVWEDNLCCNSKIDYEKVNPILSGLQKKSMDFLAEGLSLIPKKFKPSRAVKSFTLFNKIVLWRNVIKGQECVVKLFNFLPCLKIIRTRYRSRYLLFGKIPLFTTYVKEK